MHPEFLGITVTDFNANKEGIIYLGKLSKTEDHSIFPEETNVQRKKYSCFESSMILTSNFIILHVFPFFLTIQITFLYMRSVPIFTLQCCKMN